MLNRRQFVQSATLAGVASALTGAAPGAAEADPQAPPAAQPASFATLPALRGQARPITNDERLARIERARALMVGEGLGAIVLTGGTSLVYYTNLRWGHSERMFAVILPAKGAPAIICPAFEADRAGEQIKTSPLAAGAELLTWHETQSPFELTARTLKARGVATGRVGIEETVRFVFADSIAQAAPAIRFVSATPVTAGCRMFKDAHELELMRLASKVTLNAYAAAYPGLRDGMTPAEYGALTSAAHQRQGFPGGGGAQFGPNSAFPHGSSVPQVIREGTMVLVDGGCSVEGYSSDISRSFVFGRPTDKMRKVFGLVKRMQRAALEAARPGVTLDTLDRAARKLAEAEGFGPGFTFFTHRLGHGIGMDGHEWPYLVENNMFGWAKSVVLKPGMTFTNEPGVYIPGEFGLRLEDDMVITENGADLFTPQSPSIDDPFPGLPAA
jgi:Xaa-Pro dipeptidase